jgi:chromosome segregation ATPase
MQKRTSGVFKRLLQGEERRVPCFLALEGGNLFAFKGREDTSLRGVFAVRDFEFADGTEDTPALIPTVVARGELYEERFFFSTREEVQKWVGYLKTTELKRWRLWAVHERLRANTLEQEVREERSRAYMLKADLESLTGKELPAREADLEDLKESLERGKEAHSQDAQQLERLTRDIDELAHENTLLRGRAEEREALLQEQTAAKLALEEKLEIAEAERKGWAEGEAMLQADLENAQEDRELLSTRLVDLQSQVEEREAALGEAEKDVRGKELDLERGRIETIQVSERARMCEDQMKGLHERVAELQKDMLQSTVAEARLRAEFEITRKELDTEREELHSLQRRLSEAEDEVKSARSALWEARKDLESQRERADGATTNCATVEDQLREARLALDEAGEQVKTHEGKVNTLNARLLDYVDQVEVGRARLREREQSELKTIEMLSQETQSNEELQAEVSRLQVQINDIYGEHRAMAEEVRRTHRALSSSEERNAKLTARVEAFDAFSLKHSAEKTVFQAAIGRSQRQTGTFESQLSGSEMQAHRLQDLLEGSLEDKLSLERENSRLHGELRALKSTASVSNSPSRHLRVAASASASRNLPDQDPKGRRGGDETSAQEPTVSSPGVGSGPRQAGEIALEAAHRALSGGGVRVAAQENERSQGGHGVPPEPSGASGPLESQLLPDWVRQEEASMEQAGNRPQHFYETSPGASLLSAASRIKLLGLSKSLSGSVDGSPSHK